MSDPLDPSCAPPPGAAKLGGLLAGFQRFPGLYARPPWVLDTTQVVNELKAMCQLGYVPRGAIRPTAPRHSLVVASRHVYTEMYRDDGFGHANKFEKLAEQSHEHGWPTEPRVFREVFESRLLPLIRFIDVGDMFDGHAIVVSVGKRKDAPTAQLAVLLALSRPVVLSQDSHLNRPGLATLHPDEILSVAARMEFADFSVYATGYGSVDAARRLNDRVGYVADRLEIDRKFVWGVLAILAGIGAFYGLRTPERREVVAKLVRPVAEIYVTVAREGSRAQLRLESLPVPVTTPPRLEQRLAHALLDGSRRDAVALSRSLVAPGVEGAPAVEEVSRVLEVLPCFVRGTDGLWQLGEVLPSFAA